MNAARTARQIVDSLGPEFDAAIESASMNAYDLGFREDADGGDDDAFWTEVLGQVAP